MVAWPVIMTTATCRTCSCRLWINSMPFMPGIIRSVTMAWGSSFAQSLRAVLPPPAELAPYPQFPKSTASPSRVAGSSSTMRTFGRERAMVNLPPTVGSGERWHLQLLHFDLRKPRRRHEIRLSVDSRATRYRCRRPSLSCRTQTSPPAVPAGHQVQSLRTAEPTRWSSCWRLPFWCRPLVELPRPFAKGCRNICASACYRLGSATDRARNLFLEKYSCVRILPLPPPCLSPALQIHPSLCVP